MGDVGVARRLDTRGIAAYLLIVFGATWTLQIVALTRGVRFGGSGAAEYAGTALAILLASMFVPACGAFVVRRFITREGLADAGLRLGPKRYYAWAWLGVPLLFALIYLLTVYLGAGESDLRAEALQATLAETLPETAAAGALADVRTIILLALAASLTINVLVTSIPAFGEEFGWTGYLLPRLLPLGKWRAALTYGAIWGFWHAPAIWGGYNYPGHPLLGIVLMMLFTMSVALGMTALRVRSSSVLLTSFAHASINSQGRGVATMLTRDVHPLLGGALGLVGIAVFAAVGAVLLHRTRVERVQSKSAEPVPAR